MTPENIRDAIDGMARHTDWRILIDTAIRCGIREAMPGRDAVLEAIRDGAERALRPAAHPLIGRRVRSTDARQDGVVESVHVLTSSGPIATVRCDDGTAYIRAPSQLVLLPETP